MSDVVYLPLRLPSAANLREHWAKRHRRVKSQRRAAHLSVMKHPLPCVVTLTRIAPRALDDDNLQSAFKGVRDGVADRLGVPDNDASVSWRYQQQRGKPREQAIQITIESREESHADA